MSAQSPSPQAFCFPRAVTHLECVAPLALRLADRPAEALAVLVPLLGCGEEAAALAFDGLARAMPHEARALDGIAREEQEHDALLRQLSASLPNVDRRAEMLRAARRFHISLGRGGAALHLGRIAAIDTAVCTILSRLLRSGTPIASDPEVRALFTRIRRDEAKHVKISRTLARSALPTPTLNEYGAAARAAMAGMLSLGGDAFENLGVDTDTLLRDVGRLPDGLYA